MDFVKLTYIDFILFALMVTLSSAMGFYFGCFKKQDTTKDYLLGDKKMKVFPVAMSLVASTLSGVSLIGLPSEVYMFGSQVLMLLLSVFLMGLALDTIFLPVFYNLEIANIFEYLEMRFNKKIRVIVSGINTFLALVGLPVFIYAPSLAFNYVTGLNVYLIASTMCVICIFYTTLGGIKAVVWADTFQFCVTLCTMIMVFIVGTIASGGPQAIWEKAKFGDRLEFFNLNPDPTLRNSFWSIVIGQFANWLTLVGTSQGIIQRFMSVPTYKDAKTILIIFIIFAMSTKCISIFTGLIIYAKYYDCDPLTAGYMTKADQIMPYYVLDATSNMPGVSGLFLSGLFGAALSTLSTFMNALAGTIYQDFIYSFMPSDTSEKKASTIMKLLTVLIGFIVVGLIFVVEKLGSLIQALLSLSGLTGGATLGIYILALLFPMANEKGALWSIIGSIAFMSVLVTSNQYYIFTDAIKPMVKPLYTYGCNTTLFNNGTALTSSNNTLMAINGSTEPFWLFRISFNYYTFIGAVAAIIIGLLVSWITKEVDAPPVRPELLSPCVRRFVLKSESPQNYHHNLTEQESLIMGDDNVLKTTKQARLD